MYPDYGVLSLFLPVFVEGKKKKKKIVRPDETRFFFFFRFSGSSSHVMRARQHVIIEQQFITPLDRSMGKTRDLPLPQVFLLSRQRQLEIYGFHARTTTLIIVSTRQCYYPERQEIREDKLIVVPSCRK